MKYNNNTVRLNPDFITGLTDAERCFSIRKHKDNRAKLNTSISLRFKITMLENETKLLCMVKDFFDCGFIIQFAVIYILFRIYIRDLSLMVKYETFNLCYMSSNLIGLKFNYV